MTQEVKIGDFLIRVGLRQFSQTMTGRYSEFIVEKVHKTGRFTVKGLHGAQFRQPLNGFCTSSAAHWNDRSNGLWVKTPELTGRLTSAREVYDARVALKNEANRLESLSNESFDVLVIGEAKRLGLIQ